MKFGIYAMRDSNLIVRCVDGVFACINRPTNRKSSNYFEALMSAQPIHSNQTEIKVRVMNQGSLLTSSRAVASILYGVPEDVDLYEPGHFGED